MEMLKNVLIKEVRGQDYVFVVNNLPKALVYRQTLKLVPVPRHATDYDRTDTRWIEDYTLRDETMPDEPRNRRITGKMVDELLPGIEMSQTGDGGLVFFAELNEAKDRLKAIDNYIQMTLPPLSAIPRRVCYAAQEGSFLAPPKPLALIPRVELPEPLSPPVVAPSPTAGVHSSPETLNAPVVAGKKTRKPMSEEAKMAARLRLAKAREAKKLKTA